MIDFQLVDPEFVENCLARREVGEAWIVLEAQFTSPDQPPPGGQSGHRHIPGALQVHPSYLEAGTDQTKYYPNYLRPSDGNLLPDRKLARAVGALGITPDTGVVIYGSEPDGTMAAARLAWGLMYAGTAKIRLLDGGIDAWVASGRVTLPAVRSAANILLDGDDDVRAAAGWISRPEVLATTAEVVGITRASGDVGKRLVDVRELGEWDGTAIDHYPFLHKAGHIPTALYQGDWDNLLDMATHKLGPHLEAVAERWRKQGIIDPEVEAGRSTLVFYCGTGWRSSVSFLVALLLGLRAKNYDDGFYGWSWDEKNEIALG